MRIYFVRFTLLLIMLSGTGLVAAEPLMPVKLVTGPEYMPFSDPLLAVWPPCWSRPRSEWVV